MVNDPKNRRTCPNGHVYYKSSDCPACPVCEAVARPDSGWQARLSAPARRALANAGIYALTDLAGFSEKELLRLHGMGQASLPVLREELAAAGLSFRD